MQMQVQFAFPMLQDKMLLVRIEAARILAPIPVGDLPAELALAAELEPGDASFVYVYAVGLNSLGESQQAIRTLQDALVLHPRNREILTALVSFLCDSGDAEAAGRYAEELRALQP